MIPAVAETWAEIAAETRTEPGWHVRRTHAASATPLYAGIKLPERTKGLLLEVRAQSIHPASAFPACSGFDVNLVPVAPGPNGSVRICLELTDARYGGVFAVLADDVAMAVASARSEKEGVAALIGRLNTWQRFMKRHGDRLLSEQEQTGLYAELFVLRELLAHGLGASAAVDAWQGPWAGAQDFRLPNCSVEVKATASPGSASFEVSNLVQLDERPLPCLVVRHVALTRAEGQGETLPDMIDAISCAMSASDPSAGIRFSDSLLEIGYLRAHRANYGKEGFAMHSDRQFLVRGNFPRIRADELYAGVTACSYSVSLTACLPFLIDAAEARRMMHGTSNER